jgi:hypothetical protein
LVSNKNEHFKVRASCGKSEFHKCYQCFELHSHGRKGGRNVSCGCTRCPHDAKILCNAQKMARWPGQWGEACCAPAGDRPSAGLKEIFTKQMNSLPLDAHRRPEHV